MVANAIDRLQRLAVSVSFGLVAIWCMHFVANQAIILGDGDKRIQLSYNPGFTSLSAVLPIIFLFCGFTTVELRQPGQPFFWPALIVAGIVAGLAITGMHYIGNFGISNYKLHFPLGYVLSAVTIAISASITALALFFYFKERWINSLSRRLICAGLLAGAVSGMHWVASVGTRYTLVGEPTAVDGVHVNVNLIVAIVIVSRWQIFSRPWPHLTIRQSFLACIICLTLAFLTQRRKRQLAARAQHVVLASATFDPEGRLLVTQEGLLPSRKITNVFNQRTFNDEFNIAHPVFQWLYRVSFNWAVVADLVPAMREHVRSHSTMKDETAPSTPASNEDPFDQGELTQNYTTLFREYFCVAAAELASDQNVQLSDIGTLYCGTMPTGSSMTDFQRRRRKLFHWGKNPDGDAEAGVSNPVLFGRGQLLFLVRQADRHETQRLLNNGYRFASVQQVGDIIARSLQVRHTDITSTIDRIQNYCQEKNQPQTGKIYLAGFALRPAVKTSLSGWEVLVSADTPSRLPMVELPTESIQPWQQDILDQLDGHNVTECITFLKDWIPDASKASEKAWMEKLVDIIQKLSLMIPESFFRSALFCARAVTASGIGKPASAEGEPMHDKTVQIYAFSVIPDVHVASIKSTELRYVPLSFFRCSQRVYENSPDHAILERKIHREFSGILSGLRMRQSVMSFRKTNTLKSAGAEVIPLTPTTPSERKDRMLLSPLLYRNSQPSNALPVVLDSAADPSSTATPAAPGTSTRKPLGGIMISKDTTIEVHNEAGGSKNLGISTEAGQGAIEQPTYVDELYKIATRNWQKA